MYPLRGAPAPRAALHSRPSAGCATAAATDSPSRCTATDTVRMAGRVCSVRVSVASGPSNMVRPNGAPSASSGPTPRILASSSAIDRGVTLAAPGWVDSGTAMPRARMALRMSAAASG